MRPRAMQRDNIPNNHVTKTGKLKDKNQLNSLLVFVQLLTKPGWKAWKKVTYTKEERANH